MLRRGRMLKSIKLLGTQLELVQGQHVWITPALNQPESPDKWFAKPVGGLWAAPAPQQDDDVSILIRDDDFEFIW